ncbi:hypothetical protein AAG906_014939 [Vitis piasezkii]
MKEKDWCWENMAFMMGNGTKISFWNDLWCGCTVLSQRFPHLYGMAAHRNGTVEDMWDRNVGQGHWDLLGARCSRLIGSREEGGISLIGASCVDVKRKL